jgi:RimJ/RimL family protein N-acetyltransferase
VSGIPDLRRLKAVSSRDAALRLPIALPDGEEVGSLLLAGAWILQDEALLEQVTQWRGRNRRMFLSQFEPTPQRTAAYFRDLVLPAADRVLFFLRDPAGQVLGHLGIANWGDTSAELDNLVRGVGGGHPQLTAFAERRLLQWVFENSPVRTVFARVLSYNWMAQDLHTSIGFVATGELALRKVMAGDEVQHEIAPPEGANVGYRCVVMEITAPPR